MTDTTAQTTDTTTPTESNSSMAYTQIFADAIATYNNNTPDNENTKFVYEPTELVDLQGDLLSYLPEGNAYSETISGAFSAGFSVDAKSIDAKDVYNNYSLDFNTLDENDQPDGNVVTVEQKTTVGKDSNLGGGNDKVSEAFTYSNTLGDSFVVNHDYVTSTTKVTDAEDIETITKQNFSDVVTKAYKAENGAIQSTSTSKSTYTYNDSGEDKITLKTTSNSSLDFKSPSLVISKSESTTESSTLPVVLDEATVIPFYSHVTDSESYILEKIEEYNYKDTSGSSDAYSLNYKASLTNTTKSLSKFSFVDKVLTLDVSGAITQDDSGNDEVSKGASLKLVSANFTMNSKLADVEVLSSYLNVDKIALSVSDIDSIVGEDGTTLAGTAGADNISVNAPKKIAATSMSRSADGLVGVSIDAGDGNDTVVGGGSADELNGGAGNDILTGGAGADTLDGGEGNDILTGGIGADVFNSGEGKDKFVIDNKDSGSIVKTLADPADTLKIAVHVGSDTIEGFDIALDRIALGVAGSKSNFKIVDESTQAALKITDLATDFDSAYAQANIALTKATGKERFAFVSDGTDGYVFNDTNGDGKADQVIVLTGITEGFTAQNIIAS
jgi:Ca2+-binding RTX toxin-like protein